MGLRPPHYPYVLKHWPQEVDWFEVISENYMVAGGRPLYILDQVRERYPVVMHGVSLSVGSTDPLDRDYLKKLKRLAGRVRPAWISDHLCWTGTGGHNLHDLLPLPYTEEAVRHVVRRVEQVQDLLGRPILLENVSSYMAFTGSVMTEWDFLRTIAEESDCRILLDINNIYVSSINHAFDPEEYIRAIPRERVAQFHLAGHSEKKGYLLDTHDHPVKQDVWDLYRKAMDRFGPVSTLIEWDDHIPSFPRLGREVDRARKLYFENTFSQKNRGTPLEAHYGA